MILYFLIFSNKLAISGNLKTIRLFEWDVAHKIYKEDSGVKLIYDEYSPLLQKKIIMILYGLWIGVNVVSF